MLQTTGIQAIQPVPKRIDIQIEAAAAGNEKPL